MIKFIIPAVIVFLIVLFWEKISRLKMSYVEQGFSDYVGMQRAISETIEVMNQHFYFLLKLIQQMMI